ncbi:TIGR01777 family oxidoreductase [Bacillus sp. AK128]
MNIAITGGTGFVGKALTNSFIENGHHVYILTRSANKEATAEGIHYVQWLTEGSEPEQELNNIDVFINLAGESLNSGRWTSERKARIVNSRVTATKEVIRILQLLQKKPSVLINASAVGYYGISREKEFTEESQEHGNDFLAETVITWEKEASEAKKLGVRTVFTRFGIILDRDEGALPKMLLPYRLYAGGTVGSGEQWLSWVHIDDVVGMIQFAIDESKIEGPLNVVSPQPVKMKEFGKTIARVMKKPHWLPAPSFALKALLGEMSILVLEGQKVLPKKAEQYKYDFVYQRLDDALTNILK